jgi:hypothetical protein
MEPYLVGLLLAVAICGAATLTGLDRERAFYTTVLAVVASYYLLFAVMSGSRSALWLELAIGGAFVVLAFVGFSFNLWVVVAGLAGHGMFDFFHALFIENDGVPWWWPSFCLAFDVAAAVYLAALLRSRAAALTSHRIDDQA